MIRFGTVADGVLRLAMTSAHALLQLGRRVRRPETLGAHALPLTPEGRLILVKLRYAPGWRLPGGARDKGEDAVDAALRELREEIGMTAHGEVRLATVRDEISDLEGNDVPLLIVRDVRYRPRRWSWEVEEISEVPLDRLPPDLSPRVAGWLETVRSRGLLGRRPI